MYKILNTGRDTLSPCPSYYNVPKRWGLQQMHPTKGHNFLKVLRQTAITGFKLDRQVWHATILIKCMLHFGMGDLGMGYLPHLV